MFRALLELLVTIIVAFAARAILSSMMRSFSQSARTGFGQHGPTSSDTNTPPRQQAQPREKVTVAGELHKDPVCGMYVAESTRFQRRSGREIFYYCSEECKDKHAVTAR